MRWLIGILPIWVEAAKLAFGFFISLLEYGDTLEQAALQHWKHMFEEHRTGWFHEMVSFFDTIGILEDMGGASAILTWNTAMARDWQQPLANRCKDIACRNLRSSLEGGKYDFLLSMIPTFDSPRPLAVSVGSTGGKSLYRWMLSSHSLEVETGRYERIPRQERFCKCCWKLVFWNVLGDEFHSLTDCAHGELTRINCLDRLCEIFGSENAMTIFDAIPSLPSKSGVQQKMFWKHLGTVTSSVDRAILHERLVSLQVLDRWMTLMRSAQIQIIRETAERRFRKKLRRQMRNTTWIISSSDSDDDEVIFVSHAPGRSEGALNPWYPHFTPFRVIYFVYAHPCSLMRLSHHAFLLVSPWKRFLGDVPPHLLRECTGHRTEQNRTRLAMMFNDSCISVHTQLGAHLQPMAGVSGVSYPAEVRRA